VVAYGPSGPWTRSPRMLEAVMRRRRGTPGVGGGGDPPDDGAVSVGGTMRPARNRGGGAGLPHLPEGLGVPFA